MLTFWSFKRGTDPRSSRRRPPHAGAPQAAASQPRGGARPPARARPRHSSRHLTPIQQVSVQTRGQAGRRRARPISSRLFKTRGGAAGPFRAHLRGARAGACLPPLLARPGRARQPARRASPLPLPGPAGLRQQRRPAATRRRPWGKHRSSPAAASDGPRRAGAAAGRLSPGTWAEMSGGREGWGGRLSAAQRARRRSPDFALLSSARRRGTLGADGSVWTFEGLRGRFWRALWRAAAGSLPGGRHFSPAPRLCWGADSSYGFFISVRFPPNSCEEERLIDTTQGKKCNLRGLILVR